MEESIPKIRTDIEIIPTYYRGERALVVKDFLGLIPEPILLQGEVLNFLSFIDGKSSIGDIQLSLIRQKRGAFIGRDEIQGILDELDSSFLLDSENYRRQKERIVSEYSHLEVRKSWLSGRSYPDVEEDLSALLESFFSLEQGIPPEIKEKKIAALIAPHIDLEVGKRIYARAYGTLMGSVPERIILLGTGHNLQEDFFSLTEKDFETPLGRVKTDKEGVKSLKEAGKEVISPNDIVHRSEHSIEFQLLFLQHLFKSEISILPILCGSFQHLVGSFSRPSEIPGMSDFLKRLRLFMDEKPGETMIVAGVDFAHIGPKFGHSQQASFLLPEAKSHDQQLIEAICRGDIEQFWSEIGRVQNKYNVCGFSTLACLLEILPAAKGHLLGYDFWEEEATQSAVSFAAIALER